MVEWVLIERMFIALALGALVGVEREYARYKNRGHNYAGIRTYPLIALFGALAGYFGDIISIWLLIASVVLMGALIIAAYFAFAEHSHEYTGATSEVAGFLTFFIGILSYYNEATLAVVLAVIMTIILYARSILHNFAKKLRKNELSSTLKFAVMAFIILPFLPDKGYGPYEIFNPHTIWLMVVFISGISFVGYIVMKWFGEKAVPITGMLGGLASSTATTTSFAERSSKEKKIYIALAVGVILANSVMFSRVLLEVFVINRDLFWTMILPLALLEIIASIFCYFLWKKAKKVSAKLELESPFTIIPALKFALFFALILGLVKISQEFFSAQGIYVVSFFSGFADVDAITLSLAQLAKTTLDVGTARTGILVAVLTNVAVKGGIAFWMGGKEFGRIVLGFFSVLIALGIVLLWLL